MPVPGEAGRLTRSLQAVLRLFLSLNVLGRAARMHLRPPGLSVKPVPRTFVFCLREARPVQSEALRMDNREPTHVPLKKRGKTKTAKVSVVWPPSRQYSPYPAQPLVFCPLAEDTSQYMI